MNKITMYDMGFGDAHILEEYDNQEFNEKLLVDCGSKNSIIAKKSINNSLNLISNSLQNTQASFLLTHFHTDHYNQLQFLQNVTFEKVYLSNVYSHIPTVYRIVCIFLAYGKKSKTWKEAYNILKTIPNFISMLNPNGMLIFVREGSKFILNGDEYEVYSPKRLNELFDSSDFEKCSLYEIVNEIVTIILNIGALIEKQFAKLDEEMNTLVIKSNFDELKTQIEEALERINTLLKKHDSEIDDDTKKIIKKKIRKLKPHEANIVFGLRKERDSSNFRLLMCGDSEIKDLNHIVTKYNIRDIDIMKVPHHGTPAHASSFGLKSVEHALIPYSYPINKCGSYTVSRIYSSSPYKKHHLPQHTEKY